MTLVSHQVDADVDADVAIRCAQVSKKFGNNTVVTEVDLTVRRGEVHALMGANGAGKSTVLGMLSGRIAPSEGTIEIFGHHVAAGRPRASMTAGIRSVYQELTVVPQLTAKANVYLGQETARGGMLSERAMTKRFIALCEQFGVRIDPNVRADRLSVADQQILEIMRAVHAEARILLLDEPTAALSERERDFLLGLMRDLRDRGVTIVLVSHNIEEVLRVSDTVTVMRNSRKVASAPVAEWNGRSLVSAMVGDTPLRVERDRMPVTGDFLLEARDVRLPGALTGIDISVRSGEIVGLAGLVGSGRSSLLRSLAGAEPTSSGQLTMRGRRVRWPRSPRAAIRKLRIALLPEDRKSQGLVLGMSIPDNVTLTDLGRSSSRGLVSRRRQLSRSTELLDSLNLGRRVGFYPVRQLSGGNQQKVAIAKWLHHRPEVLLADEPTRGIDVRAKVEVLGTLRQLARDGMGVVVASAELEEVLDVSDRVLVLSEGRVVAEIDMHEQDPTVGEVLNLAFGV
jgi:ABC-type sugar transport system ATPase subunit